MAPTDPEMDYRLVETGGDGGINGGIMKPKEGPWPGNLAFYIDVDDLEAYCEKIKSGRQGYRRTAGSARSWRLSPVRGPGWAGAGALAAK